MLQKLMDTYPDDGDFGVVSYQEYLINWIFMLVFASIHTTTENSTMVLYWLMKYPQYTKELLEEQKEVIESEGTKGQDVELTFDVVKKLVKLDSFVREVFRLRTVGLGLQHKNISGHDLELSNGTVVPAGEHVYINGWDISRSSELQGDDVDEFRPWRFLESRKQAVKIGEDHITFGVGK
jgi:cytochrome P450